MIYTSLSYRLLFHSRNHYNLKDKKKPYDDHKIFESFKNSGESMFVNFVTAQSCIHSHVNFLFPIFSLVQLPV